MNGLEALAECHFEMIQEEPCLVPFLMTTGWEPGTRYQNLKPELVYEKSEAACFLALTFLIFWELIVPTISPVQVNEVANRPQ